MAARALAFRSSRACRIRSAQQPVQPPAPTGEQLAVPHVEGTRYFELHSERDHEHAELSRRVLERAEPADADRIVAAAERALQANWVLLDGVERIAGSRP